MLRRVALTAALSLVALGCSDGGSIDRAGSPKATRPTTSSSTTTAPVTDATPGTAGLGDVIVPDAGNGGYDVQTYGLDIVVADDRASIVGTTTIAANATQSLSAFNLDLAGLTVDGVTVDGVDATWARATDELTITPAHPVGKGRSFTTVVRYSGRPAPVKDPSAPGTIGWLSAPTGTFVASEATGAKGWFPCNDHPSDKAMFTIAVTAKDADTVVANGTLSSKKAASPGHTTWTYGQTDPMATYLAQVAVGDYDVVQSTGPHGLPLRNVVVRGIDEAQRKVLDRTGDQIEYFETLFGPFPLDTYGVLVADSAPEFALETQTLTLLPAAWLQGYSPEETSGVMAHELAHQWFGDTVTPKRWSDIWLNEGFATYAEWLWNDHDGTRTLDAQVAEAMGQAQSWRNGFGPVAEPTAPFLFAPNEYGGAGIVLEALRKTIGDDKFFSTLREWLKRYGGASATTEQFEAVASEVSGQDLGAFFDSWLRSKTLPPMPA